MTIRSFMLNEKTSISVMNRNEFVQMDSRSNDRTKWLTELIDRSLQRPEGGSSKMHISELIQVHSIGYRLQDVKVSFAYDLKIDAPTVSIESKQGDISSIPRWIAEVLSSEKLAQVQDTDMVVALKQAVMKENVQGDFDLSTLELDFYIKVNSFTQRLPQEDRDKIESMLNSLIRKRQGKIIKLADSSKMTSDLAKKLTIEERTLFDYIHNNSIEFKEQILGDKI